MFTVDIRVNGVLVSHVHGENVEMLKDGSALYHYEIRNIQSREVRKGELVHDRSKGIGALVSKILDYDNRH